MRRAAGAVPGGGEKPQEEAKLGRGSHPNSTEGPSPPLTLCQLGEHCPHEDGGHASNGGAGGPGEGLALPLQQPRPTCGDKADHQ